MSPARFVEIPSGHERAFAADLARQRSTEALDPTIEAGARAILADVAARGDDAVSEHALRIDRKSVQHLGPQEARAAFEAIDAPLRRSLQLAAARIRQFHGAQARREKRVRFRVTRPDGTVLEQRIRALDRVGLYVPGGRAAYPSTVLMNAIAASEAGVREVVLVSPAADAPVVLAAAHIAGVCRIIRVGGAQAIGALAYGTLTIPRVDKIVGPGNTWVAAAKRLVHGLVDTDMIAGPSEILVISDGTAPAEWIAADLLSQAEHDPDATAICLTPDRAHADAVIAALETALRRLPREEIARASLRSHGLVAVVHDLDAAVTISELVAPEHVQLAVGDPRALSRKVHRAGCVFLGTRTCEALGDYSAGTNHVLPTGGSARFASPLGVHAFLKRTNYVEIGPVTFKQIAPATIALAEAEGLDGHAEAVRVRRARVAEAGARAPKAAT